METRTPEQLPRPIAKRHGSPPSATRCCVTPGLLLGTVCRWASDPSIARCHGPGRLTCCVSADVPPEALHHCCGSQT